MKIVFGSRGSDLALTQTRTVMARLASVCSELEIELRVIKTTGDIKADASLEEIGGLGAFTREIEMALLNGEIDVAVHSLKDLPTKQPEGLIVAAVAGRECPNDMLITKEGYTLQSLPVGAVVGTSSLRRRAQLLALRPDLDVRELRGNVPTRLRRVSDGELDAVILAAAGLNRLGLSGRSGIYQLSATEMLPAPGQGALALETRSNDDRVLQLLAKLHDPEVAAAVNCERAALQAFGGGCRAPLGVYAQVMDNVIHVQAFAANMETGKVVRLERDAPVDYAMSLGEEIGRELHDALHPRGHILAGRRIVITRAPHQAASFGRMLEEAGADVFYLPLIDIAPVPDAVLPDPSEEFDWLIFTSVNAVECFHWVLQQHGRGISAYSNARIAAIGEATAAAIKACGLQVDCMPESHVSHALVDALLAHEAQPEGKRVLLLQGNLARPVVAEALTAKGMDVHAVVVYQTVSCAVSEAASSELQKFKPHCISFFSPSMVNTYISTGLRDNLVQSSTVVLHASIGPVTTSALQQGGCTPIAEAAQQNEASLMDAIATFFA